MSRSSLVGSFLALMMIAAFAAPGAIRGVPGPATGAARAPTTVATPAWVLTSTEPSQTVNQPSGCYNSQQVTVGGLSATTYGKCTSTGPEFDVYQQTQHSWSAAPPQILVPGEKLQITVTASLEGTFLSVNLGGGAVTGVRVDLIPGGGPQAGSVGVQAAEGQSVSDSSDFEVPAGSAGSVMVVALEFVGIGGSGATKYIYEWQEAPGTTTAPQATSTAPTSPGIDDDWISSVVIDKIRGDVERSTDNVTWRPVGDVPLRLYDSIRTGPNSFATLVFEDGSIFRIKPNSQVTILGDGLQVQWGEAWFNLRKQGKTFQVFTPETIVGVLGTTIVTRVSPNGTTRIELAEGIVSVTARRTNEQVELTAGNAATVTTDGRIDVAQFDVEAMRAEWQAVEDALEAPSAGSPGQGAAGPDPVVLGILVVIALALVALIAFALISLALQMKRRAG